jgi:hypothetical protein
MVARVLLMAMVAWFAGCEKTDHATIDKWLHTSKGAEKLQQAVVDDALPSELSAHAAANLVKRSDDQAIYAAFGTMGPGRRAEIIAQLAPRLWEIARVESERELPGAPQVAAKDVLVRIRKWADEPSRAAIDRYLIDWYCVASYEDRAKGGANLGAAVLRMIGPAAAPKLVTVANGVVAAPGQGKVRNRIGDELLLGLAATGSPDAVKYVIDIAKLERGDPTLAARAMSALYRTYVDPDGAFEVVVPDALVPNLPALVEIAKDDTREPRVANDAVALIRAVGPPMCLAPLLGMVGAPHRDPAFKLVAANNALKCGGAAVIVDAIRALPEGGSYANDQIGGIARTIAGLGPHQQAQTAARALLGERSTVAKWVAIEVLAAMKATDDAPRIAGLARRRERLTGYWGERGQGKAEPTLGQRAAEVSASLGGK